MSSHSHDELCHGYLAYSASAAMQPQAVDGDRLIDFDTPTRPQQPIDLDHDALNLHDEEGDVLTPTYHSPPQEMLLYEE